MTNTNQDRYWEILYDLAESLTGQSYTKQQRSGLLRNNLLRRVKILGFDGVGEYLSYLNESDDEWPHFLSLVTIHTTSWFREEPHYRMLGRDIEEHIRQKKGVFRLLCSACSTGQEVYSAALILEKYRRSNPTFDYKVDAFDIDPLSIDMARRAVYNKNSLATNHWNEYKHMLMLGKNKAEGYFTFAKEIRSRVHFYVSSILEKQDVKYKYDWIMCRNVLIYFKTEHIHKALLNLKSLLDDSGRLCIGHSESFETEKLNLKLTSNSVYVKSNMIDKVKVQNVPVQNVPAHNEKVALVVDDSQVIRKKLAKILTAHHFKVLEAADTVEADRLMRDNSVQFLTVDLHMPGLDGVTWIKKIRSNGIHIPAVMVSDSTLEDAPQILSILGHEIHDFFDKKTLNSHPEYLVEKAIALTSSNVKEKKKRNRDRNRSKLPDLGYSNADLILIGASTGGTTALVELLSDLPKPCPPIMIVQHITANFSKPFAERLAFHAKLKLGDPTPGRPLEQNTLYMSFGDHHIGVAEEVGRLVVKTSNEGPISRHRPSVDFLFSSGAQLRKKPNLLGILLTGMGADGAEGLLRMSQAGAFTACQDEESCVVFGMPKEAIRLGAAQFVGDLSELRQLIIRATGEKMLARDIA